MSRELTYTVETRQSGEPRRLVWRGQGKQVACDAARALGRESRLIEGYGSIPVHPFVRVRQGKVLVLDITPASRQAVA